MFDQLVRQLPDGVYLKSVKQSGSKVQMVGYAQSNARVSTLMRNIEASPWIDKPELVEIKLVPTPGAQAAKGSETPKINEFTLNFQVKRAAPPPDARPVSAPAKGSPGPAAAPGAPAAPSKGAKA
jgi:type IV pilus assembly protein PilN